MNHMYEQEWRIYLCCSSGLDNGILESEAERELEFEQETCIGALRDDVLLDQFMTISRILISDNSLSGLTIMKLPNISTYNQISTIYRSRISTQ